MPTFTCLCGQPYSVTPERAAQTFTCSKCGKTLKIPAMGVLVPPKSKPKRATNANPVRWRVMPGLLAACFVFLFVCAGSWLAWTIGKPAITEPILLAKVESDPVEKKKRETSHADERKREEPKGSETTPIVERVVPINPPKKELEPIRPKDPPVVIVEPMKPKDPPIVEKRPANLIEPLKLVWKLKEEETFFQELVVTQKPSFKVQGLPIAMVLQYRIVSRFRVKKRNEDGSLVVEQKIESAKLLQADDLSKPTITAALTQMAGAVYTLELSPKMEVTKLESAGAQLNVNALQLGGGFGMQMSSLLDRDGWKELAQATFFQLDAEPKAKMRWSKPMSHQWGALGSWSGHVHYLYLGPQNNLHRISYGLQLAYKTPNGSGVGMMKINSANFQTQEAGGVLFFDAVKGRVASAEERFHVRGVINANLLGQNTLVEIDEDQHFAIRIYDKLP